VNSAVLNSETSVDISACGTFVAVITSARGSTGAVCAERLPAGRWQAQGQAGICAGQGVLL
jgi:hypothetical protein